MRLHAARVESRSLTLSKFDFQGKPHIFYDDHLQLLRRSDCFVARKIWPRANLLYNTFLTDDAAINRMANATGMMPNPEFYLMGRVPKQKCYRRLASYRAY